ncbi:LysR family transcriptional regulator [Pseudomonas sp. P7759]|uniref:LysR family transcriptional regulator n=1 Tax=Pseudomonas sp. P7759 TaxID=2738831 RepID=UPI0015A3EC95|nr:LysR family transcriptional regulator [Pseudomonas sp. P7759]NWC75745.1 LysR family transcriptional regulator [Pseudomonas sp. P7759]
MDRIEAMTLLLATIDTGSFSAAGRALRVPVQTVSRKVAELERCIGTQLLTRTTRKIALTDAGASYAQAARSILEQLAEAERVAAGEFVAPRGDLVISAPELFGRLHVLPVVSDFLERFADINIKLVLGDRNVDLFDDQIDLVVRIGHLPDSGMIASQVGTLRGVVCASPRLLEVHGVPQTPQALKNMPCISTFGPNITSTWRFIDPHAGSPIELALTPRLLTSAVALVDAAIQGTGVARLLHYQAFEAIDSGTLRVVLEDYELTPFPVHLLYAGHPHMPLKMRRFLEFATPRLRQSLAHFSTHR